MAWGTLTIGSLVLKETDILDDVTNANTGERTVRVSGAETNPGNGTGNIEAKQQDIMSLMDRIMPVTFERKPSYNGYYRATDTNTTLEQWGEGPGQVRWSLTLEFLGADNALDLESRVANVVRSNDFGLTGERWQAPPTGHYGYYVGAVSPATVVRQGETGPITVYRALPAGVNPRYGCPVGGYQGGRVRFYSGGGLERVGERFPVAVADWEMNNGLVRVRPHTDSGWFTTLKVAFWDGAAWQEKFWDVRIAGDSLRPTVDFKSVVVTRNDNECVIVRIVWAQPSDGKRGLLDLTLRRGSRFVEGYVQRTVSGQISVQLDSLEAWTDNVNHVIAAGEDANGLRYVAGRSKNFDPATNGGVSDSSTTTMDFFIGVEVPKPDLGGVNPRFETGTAAPWVGTNGTVTVVSGGAKYGTYFGRVTATAAAADLKIVENNPGVAGVAGKQYTLSGWLRSPVAVTAGQAFITIHWYSGASPGTYMSSTGIAAPALAANVWTPVSGTATAPAGTTFIGRQASLLAAVVSAGTVLDVDSLLLREATDSGDTAATLVQQYMGAMAEKVGVVRR